MTRAPRVLAILVLAVIGVLVAAMSPAQADVQYRPHWFATGHTAVSNSRGSWHPCGVAQASPYETHLSCAKSAGRTVTFSATVTGTQKVGDGTLSEQVGYSVTKTYTETISYTVDVPPHHTAKIYWAVQWYRHRVTQQECTIIVQTGRCTGNYYATAYAYTHKYRTLVFKVVRG